jgi:hypothetical protein
MPIKINLIKRLLQPDVQEAQKVAGIFMRNGTKGPLKDFADMGLQKDSFPAMRQIDSINKYYDWLESGTSHESQGGPMPDLVRDELTNLRKFLMKYSQE